MKKVFVKEMKNGLEMVVLYLYAPNYVRHTKY